MSQPNNFNDYATALRMKEVIARLVREETDRQRPLARYGKVFGFNRFTGTCEVLFPGDTVPTRVRTPQSVQPTRRIEVDGEALADVVKVEGTPGNMWVTEVISGPTFQLNSNLYSPSLYGGEFLHQQQAKYFSLSASALPNLNESWFFARWSNAKSFASDGLAYLDVVVQQSLFANIIKKYSIAVRSSDTSDVWKKCVPTSDSGPWADNEFGLEIRAGGDYIELRVRRVMVNTGGFTPGSYDLSVWFHGQDWDIDRSVASGYIDTGVEPTRVHGTTSVDGKGPFLSPGMNLPNRHQSLLSGGGAVSYTSGGVLKWTERFIMIGGGRNFLETQGYFNIPAPLGGVSIPVYGNDSKTSVTTVAGGVPLDNWEALYYETPYGTDTNDEGESKLRIVFYNGTKYFQVPSNWILVAVKNGDTQSGVIRLGNGTTISQKVNLTYSGSWGIFGSGFLAAGYTRQGERVFGEGLVKNTSASASVANSLVATLPPSFRPGGSVIFSVNGNAVNSVVRVDILNNGEIRCQTSIPAGGWFTLDGVSFRSEA